MKPTKTDISEKNGLPKGKYEVRVLASGFNATAFTFTVDRNDRLASKEYFVITLAVACSGGGEDLKLVKSLKRQ